MIYSGNQLALLVLATILTLGATAVLASYMPKQYPTEYVKNAE